MKPKKPDYLEHYGLDEPLEPVVITFDSIMATVEWMLQNSNHWCAPMCLEKLKEMEERYRKEDEGGECEGSVD